ncbi:S8 family serine peptidase [Erythrobacter colymbi]|uniref:S8 family serine peptidase n=1 Tax=Erythrobacter colymbi TaxID=1161202 RepID=UPI001F0A344C|nr:S8 family serine peptidase [Erythrobacter colymbi]
MMRRPTQLYALAALAGVLAAPVAAQLQVPGVGVPVPPVGRVLGEVTDRLDRTVDTATAITEREARRLLRLREAALDRLLRANPQAIERDSAGNLARHGELLVTGPDAASLAVLEKAGFRILSREEIEGLDIAFVRLAVPAGMSLAEAQTRAAALAPDAQIEADTLHLEAGAPIATAALPVTALAAAAAAPVEVKVGLIDGGTGASVPVAARKGFASGAPAASDHGSAVASLLRAQGLTRLWAADVYGTDPAGGSASAVAKALGWLAASGCKVVTVSLVGPRSALLEKAVIAAQGKGVVVVAAVGNDGPAAPPAYPASYSGVLAITGVDRKGRALIEAGRALHLDYAAPGAEVWAMDAAGKRKAWRGTSFATPLAAARVAAALAQESNWRAALDREARDLGTKGADATYGRGVLCESCGKKK